MCFAHFSGLKLQNLEDCFHVCRFLYTGLQQKLSNCKHKDAISDYKLTMVNKKKKSLKEW